MRHRRAGRRRSTERQGSVIVVVGLVLLAWFVFR